MHLQNTREPSGCLTRFAIIVAAVMAIPLLCGGGYIANRELRYEWALLAYQMGNAKGAIKQLDQLNNYRDARRMSAQFRYNEGVAAMERGDWETARGLFQGSRLQINVSRKFDELTLLEDQQHERISAAFPLAEGRLHDLALSADGTLAAVSFGDTTIAVWDFQSRQELARLDKPRSNAGQYIALSPDGELVAFAPQYGPVHVWRWRDGVVLWDAELTAFEVLDLAFSSQGATLNALGNEYSTRHVLIRRWQASDGAPEEETAIETRYGYAQTGALSPDGRLIALEQGPISIRSVADGRVLDSIPCDSCYPQRIAFAPDSQTIIFSKASSRYYVEHWRIGNSALLQTITHDTEIYAVAANLEGSIITGTESGMLIFWRQPDDQVP